MTASYKVIGIDPAETGVSLGNCLTMRRSRDLVNTPDMYAKVRVSAMGWMNSPGSIHQFVFSNELFASDVALEHVISEPVQQGHAMESAILVAALLIAFPDARFGIGLARRTLASPHEGKSRRPLSESASLWPTIEKLSFCANHCLSP